MAEHKLRTLHISDLHERGPREKEAFRRRRVLGDAWERNLDALLEDGPFDLVCFTGDAADWGKPEEYGPAGAFLAHVVERVAGGRMDRLFIVPGNHDVQRSGKNTLSWDKQRAKLLECDPLALSRWMFGGKPPRGISANLRDQILARSQSYRDWLATIGRAELQPDPTLHPHLGYRRTLRLPGLPFDVHLIGLDSAWLAGSDNDAGKLLLTEDQVGRLASDRGELLAGFRLALVHHPLTDLHDCDDARKRLSQHVDLLLHGHRHSETFETWQDASHSARQLAAGCLYEGDRTDHWPNACHAIETVLDDAGRPLRHALRFRAWSSNGYWVDDNRPDPRAQNGRTMWHIAPPPVVSVEVPSVFVGRTSELAKLAAALLPASNAPSAVVICALHGMPGVGKSYLADHFAALHRARFPGGYVHLVLDPQNPTMASTLFGNLADQLKTPAHPDALRQRLLDGRVLVHIENVDGDDAAAAAAEVIENLRGCPIIVTGRYRNFGRSRGWSLVEIEPFSPAAALEQLTQEYRAPRDGAERRSFERLVEKLGYLPLAIHLAAGYLANDSTPDDFLALLHERGLDVPYADPADRSRAILRHAFDASLELLRRKLGPDADRLLDGLYALGHAPASGFGRSLGAAITSLDERDFGRLITDCRVLSILGKLPAEERPHDDGFRVHPLLAERLRTHSASAAGIDRMTGWFLARLPEGDRETQGRRWDELHGERDALAEWLLMAPNHDLARIERAGTWYAMLAGPFHAWVHFCERALTLPFNDATQSDFLWTLTNVARSAGAMDRALAAAAEKEGLDRRRGDDREAALAAGARADILQDRGQLDEALRIRTEDELPVYEKFGDIRESAVTKGKIADILQARGQLDEALRIHTEDELPVYEKLGDIRLRAVTKGQIASILQDRGQLDEALRIRTEDELPVYEKLGDIHARAVTKGKIADILQDRGQLDESLRIRTEDELPVYEKLGDIYSLLIGRAKLALTHLQRNKPDDRAQAERLLQRALSAAEQLRIPEAERIRSIQKDYGFASA